MLPGEYTDYIDVSHFMEIDSKDKVYLCIIMEYVSERNLNTYISTWNCSFNLFHNSHAIRWYFSTLYFIIFFRKWQFLKEKKKENMILTQNLD